MVYLVLLLSGSERGCTLEGMCDFPPNKEQHRAVTGFVGSWGLGEI